MAGGELSFRKKFLGNLGCSVSEIGFGTIHIATKMAKREAFYLLEYARARGINFFDTGRRYQESEARLGECFEKLRSKVIYCTKSFCRDKKITKDIEKSLKKLRTDYVDVFMFHAVDTHEDLETILEKAYPAVLKKRKKGHVLHIGISSHSYHVAGRVMELDLFDCLEFPLNIINEEFVTRNFHETLIKKKIPFFAMKPFSGGVITDARLAINYVRQYDWALPLVGFEKTEEVDEVLAIMQTPPTLSENDLSTIVRLRKELGEKFCRGCGYCMPCPQGVSTVHLMYYPILLKQYGKEKLDHDEMSARFNQLDSCVECRECEKRCPFQLEIVSLMRSHREHYLMTCGEKAILTQQGK